MTKRSMVAMLVLAACGAGVGKDEPTVPDFGPEAGGKDDSATRPAVTGRIGYDSVVDFALGSGVNWRAWVFAGNQGQIVDARAQGLDGTDTILYLYKVSRITGRPYGKPLGYNDDTEEPSWALRKGVGDFNPYSSSVTNIVLPEDRDYAVVVTTYQQAGGHVLTSVHPRGAVLPTTIPAFGGTSAGTPIVFTDGDTGATVFTATQSAVSSQLQTQLNPAGDTMRATVFHADPAAVAALMVDPHHIGLAYSFLYGDTKTQMYDSSWTPIQRTEAVDQLISAWGDDTGMTRPIATFVMKSMFKDSAFRAADVSVFRIHSDNGDDTNAEGIAAVKASTGEIRVFALINPA